MCVVNPVFFFFFQAEDGIRDLTVTGVQTCALPISAPSDTLCVMLPSPVVRNVSRHVTRFRNRSAGAAWALRSEERRGGEEGRSRGAADHLKKKKIKDEDDHVYRL